MVVAIGRWLAIQSWVFCRFQDRSVREKFYHRIPSAPFHSPQQRTDLLKQIRHPQLVETREGKEKIPLLSSLKRKSRHSAPAGRIAGRHLSSSMPGGWLKRSQTLGWVQNLVIENWRKSDTCKVFLMIYCGFIISPGSSPWFLIQCMHVYVITCHITILLAISFYLYSTCIYFMRLHV